MKYTGISLALMVALAGCGDGGGGATPVAPAPPVLLPLAWQDVPTAPVSVNQGDTVTVTLLLSAAVSASYGADASGGNVTVTTETLRAGVVRLRITGVNAGTSQVNLTASADGYSTARASFAVNVIARPSGITGTWEGSEATDFLPYDWRFDITDVGGFLSGSVYTRISFSFQDAVGRITSGTRVGDSVRINFAGDLDGSFDGTWFPDGGFILGFIEYDGIGPFYLELFPVGFVTSTAEPPDPASREDVTHVMDRKAAAH